MRERPFRASADGGVCKFPVQSVSDPCNLNEVPKGPKPADDRSEHDLFRTELVNLIDQRHELVWLAELINWQAFEAAWNPQFESTTGRPALPTRRMAALLYLRHVYALSDEDTVERWCENPYWQHFSGERYFRHELPCDPSSLVRWRRRIGEEGCEWLLAHSIEAARRAGVVKTRSMEEVVLDTTVQEKAIAHPTDSRLLNRAREQLVGAAQRAGIALRQSYVRVGKAAEAQAGRYATPDGTGGCGARSGSKTWLGRVIRDVERKGGEITGALAERLAIALVEPMIGHMKADGHLARNWLKGAEGDALLCGAGQNLPMILRHPAGALLRLSRPRLRPPDPRTQRALQAVFAAPERVAASTLIGQSGLFRSDYVVAATTAE